MPIVVTPRTVRKLFRTRPRGVRGVGRTSAAVYRACERLVASPGNKLVYVTRTREEVDRVLVLAEEILRDQFKVDVRRRHTLARIVTKVLNGMVWPGPEAGPPDGEVWSDLIVYQASGPADIEAVLRDHPTACLADDLGEWADRGPALSERVEAFVKGEPVEALDPLPSLRLVRNIVRRG